MSKRLEILKASLDKKKAELDNRFDRHFADVKSANGQPLNDKRNGRATMDRWDRQSDGIRNQMASIAKTERAIDIEESKIADVEHHRATFPPVLIRMIDNGELQQWRKHPHTFFVPGVDKARIVWLKEKGDVAHKFTSTITDPDQWRKFAKTYNGIRIELGKA